VEKIKPCIPSVRPKNNDMKVNLLMTIFLPAFCSCQSVSAPTLPANASQPETAIHTIQDIPLPAGYKRIALADSSFGYWLRRVPVKKDRRVHLYNGELKRNQSAQYVVLDVPVGHKDLQQCADAVMRLRATYLYSRRRFSSISFSDNNGIKYTCPGPVDSTAFERYLERVYAYCGTASLEKQLHKVIDFRMIEPGDVLIRGGAPGHAVIVMDVATNSTGQKIYLLAQSYMPAQEIHVLVNPNSNKINPWYAADPNPLIYSPEWTFSTNQLRRW
jgi:hypothetical protein